MNIYIKVNPNDVPAHLQAIFREKVQECQVALDEHPRLSHHDLELKIDSPDSATIFFLKSP